MTPDLGNYSFLSYGSNSRYTVSARSLPKVLRLQSRILLKRCERKESIINYVSPGQSKSKSRFRGTHETPAISASRLTHCDSPCFLPVRIPCESCGGKGSS